MTERDGVWKQIIPHNPRGLTWSSALKEWNKEKKNHADSKLSQSISRTLCSDGLPSRLQWTGDPITHTFFSPPASDYQWCMQTCTMTPPMVPAHFLCISNHHSYQITGMLQLVIVPQLIKDGNSVFFYVVWLIRKVFSSQLYQPLTMGVVTWWFYWPEVTNVV